MVQGRYFEAREALDQFQEWVPRFDVRLQGPAATVIVTKPTTDHLEGDGELAALPPIEKPGKDFTEDD